MKKQEKNNDDKTINRIIQIVLFIIIILLLLQNCSLIKKKEIKENNKINNIDIKCNSNKCQQSNAMTDCLHDEENTKCLVPNFVGKTKKDVINWLNSISNNIEIEIKYVENQNYKDGVILEQSTVGTSVKDLLSGRTKLVITIVNNGSLVDCQKDSQNTKCILPNFIDRTKSDIDSWIEGIANHIKIKYAYVDSPKKSGTIINQSIKSGTLVKDILDKNETIIIYISKGDNDYNEQSTYNNDDNQSGDPTPSPDPEPELDDDFYVSDNEIIKWQDNININIFEDSAKISKVNGKIAPESKGIYKFSINNGTKYNLKYKISFKEKNQHNMNMKFKLKKGNTYLVDQYVSYNQLNIDNMILNAKKSDTYYLEWKWLGDNDSNDTAIGNNAKNSDISYELKINVEAENIQ